MKYICTQCTGRSAEEHTFELDEEPNYCPWCGSDRHVETIEHYLRGKVAEKEMESKRWEEEYQALRNKIRALPFDLDSDHEFTEEDVEAFVEKFDGVKI